jgi:hypothetical protein
MTSDTATRAGSLVIALIVVACASMSATGRYREPEQSALAGGASRLDWVRPAEAGYVAGIESNSRNEQSLGSNPPG